MNEKRQKKIERDQKIIAMLQTGKTYTNIADKVGVAISTVHNVKKRWEKKNRESLEKTEDSIYRMVQSEIFANIARDALNLLNAENLKIDVDTRGVGNLYRLVGVFVDKTIAIDELELRRQHMNLKRRELELKEKELELRISNPEAFHTVQIVNDAPKDEEEDNALAN